VISALLALVVIKVTSLLAFVRVVNLGKARPVLGRFSSLSSERSVVFPV
jgi:hypothetical protein